MNPMAVGKLVLAAAGIVVFLVGVRTGVASVRWTGIGLVAAAWLLRFVGRRSDTKD